MMNRSNESVSIFKANQLRQMGFVFLILFLHQLSEVYYWERENLPVVMVLFGAAIALSVAMIFAPNRVTLNSQRVLYNTCWKQYQLDWSEIKRIEIDKQGHKVVFLTSDENKRLAVFGLSCVAGLEERLALEAQTRHIVIEKTGRAAYLDSKNTSIIKNNSHSTKDEAISL